MAYKYMVLPEPDEWGGIHTTEDVFFAATDGQLNKVVRQASQRNPHATIAVYQLVELQKIKDQPTYQRYKVNGDGEILPF